MNKKSVLVLVAAVALAASPPAYGAGFLIYEHGAAAMAMGGAFTAVANNPTAIWHNPAGLAWVDGTQISIGGTFIIPSGSVTMPNLNGSPTFNQINQVFTPPNIYLSHKFSDRITAGIGFMAPFGLGTKWMSEVSDPPTFPLAYLGYSNEMETFFINPTIAVKVLDNLSLGFGVSYIFSSLTLDLYQLLPPESETQFNVPSSMHGTGNSFNFNAGILYKAKAFSLGASYRSQFDIDYSGTVTLDKQFIPAPYQGFFPSEGDVKTTFKFPAILTFGLAVNITPKLLWSFDFHTYFWGRFDAYSAEITFPSPFPPETLTAIQNWKDAHCTRMGLQYQATEKLALRLGGLFDETPQPVETMDPNLPDNDRWAIQLGAGYTMGKFTVDVAYHFEHFMSRTSQHGYIFTGGVPYDPNPAAGTYNTEAHLIGVSLGYKF
jgi:long-chain fatty acid transport protein